MLKRDAEWVSSVVTDFERQSDGAAILPSIQVNHSYLDEDLAEEEFERNLKAALRPPSQGVVFWSWAHLEQDSLKKAVVRKIVSEKKLTK